MPSGADLFVVCKQCGSEVSPYITECPYCGSRLRRRAPKLPKVGAPVRQARPRSRISKLLTRSRPRPAADTRVRPTRSAPRQRRRGSGAPGWEAGKPYATIALVTLSALSWVARHAEFEVFLQTAVLGPLHGDWWRLLSNGFAYLSGGYALVALLVIAIYGWLLELRHGPATVLMLFFAASALGAVVALAVYAVPLVDGGNAAGLALLAAWAVPDLLALRGGSYYEGDLLGTGVLAALLLALPFAFVTVEISWIAGVTGLVLGLVVGYGLDRMAAAEA